MSCCEDEIKKEERALEAFYILKDYCMGQKACSDCPFAVSFIGIYSGCCLMHAVEPHNA